LRSSKGRNKKISRLLINDVEAQMVKEFFNWYLETEGSVRNCTFHANEAGYRTKSGRYWNQNQISRILKNALYCIADEDAYDYYKNHTDVQIVDEQEEFNGNHGLIFYNRRKQYKKSTRTRDQDEWILAIGEHKGIMPGIVFAKAQLKRAQNISEAPRSGQSIRSPLAGLVRCGRCGSAMSVFSSPKDSVNKPRRYFQYFSCLTRKQRSITLCDNGSVRADVLEDLVVRHITGLLQNKETLQEVLSATNNSIDDRRIPLIAKRNKLQCEMNSVDVEMNNLVDALGKGIIPELVIKKKYKELEDRKTELREEYQSVCNELDQDYTEPFDIDTVMEHIRSFCYAYEYLNFEEKKMLLRNIVKEITVDKNKVKLVLYFLPGKDFDFEPNQDLDPQALCSRMDRGSYFQ
jgi:site-specific DNA recombinase